MPPTTCGRKPPANTHQAYRPVKTWFRIEMRCAWSPLLVMVQNERAAMIMGGIIAAIIMMRQPQA